MSTEQIATVPTFYIEDLQSKITNLTRERDRFRETIETTVTLLKPFCNGYCAADKIVVYINAILKGEQAPLPTYRPDEGEPKPTRMELAAHVARLRGAIPFPAITFGNLDAILYHVLKGEPYGGLTKDALEKFRAHMLDQIEAFDRATKSTPAASLDAVIGPTVELLATALEIGKEKHHYIGFVKSEVEAELTRLQKMRERG